MLAEFSFFVQTFVEESSAGTFLLIALCILASAFFSGSEAALLSLSPAKVRALKKKKRKSAHYLEWLKAHPKKLIITILMGNNIVNILAPVLATVWATKYYGNSAIGLVTGILTLLLLVFGEILPKNIGQHYQERFSIIVSPPLYFLVRLLSPIVWLFEKLSNLFLSKRSSDGMITEDEVLAMVALGAEGGAIEKEERKLIENVLEFTDTTAEEVMTPRVDMEVMDEDSTLREAVQFFITHSHSRIPVYHDDIDEIVGIITIKQALKASDEFDDNKLIKNLELKTPIFVPITKKIDDIFRDLQRQSLHMAIVVDEHGGTAGVITVEDILEEVFGEITDETDEEDHTMRKLSERSWIVPGVIDLHDLTERTGIMLEEDLEEGKTLSRYILEQTEKIPDRGETIDTPFANLVIERMNGRKIDRVRILRKK